MRSTIIGVAATFVGSLAGIFYSELKDPSPYLTSQSASVSPDAVTLVLFMAASGGGVPVDLMAFQAILAMGETEIEDPHTTVPCFSR